MNQCDINRNPIWVSILQTVCIDGILYLKEKDINKESSTYLQEKQVKTKRTCITGCNSIWSDTGETLCENCISKKRQIDNCGNTRWIILASGICNTTPNWIEQNVFYCFSGTSYRILRDINPCSLTYNHIKKGTQAGAACDDTCIPNWINVFPLVTKCVLGHLFIQQEDGCGNLRWESADTTCDCIPIWELYSPYTERCNGGISEILQSDGCGNQRWITGGNACATPIAPTPTSITPPTAPAPVELAPCENFTNHLDAAPHLYGIQQDNILAGTVIAHNLPQYNAYGTWNYMTYAGLLTIGGTLSAGEKLYFYREPFITPTNVKLRTRVACTEYDDVRNTDVGSYLGQDSLSLTPLSPVTPMNVNFSWEFSFDMQGGDVNTNYNNYLTNVFGHHSGMQIRINGGSWVSGSLETLDSYGRAMDYTHFNTPVSLPKDFYLDTTLDSGTTVDRYIVRRCTAGGHFAGTTTLTRVSDGRVFVHTYQGDAHVPMKLAGIAHIGFGNSFDMSILSSGIYAYTLAFIETNEVIDYNVTIIVG